MIGSSKPANAGPKTKPKPLWRKIKSRPHVQPSPVQPHPRGPAPTCTEFTPTTSPPSFFPPPPPFTRGRSKDPSPFVPYCTGTLHPPGNRQEKGEVRVRVRGREKVKKKFHHPRAARDLKKKEKWPLPIAQIISVGQASSRKVTLMRQKGDFFLFYIFPHIPEAEKNQMDMDKEGGKRGTNGNGMICMIWV